MIKSVGGGYLVQSADNIVLEPPQLKCVTKRAPTETEKRDLLFAFTVAKHVKSNTIVYAKDGATVGIGAGQMSGRQRAHRGAQGRRRLWQGRGARFRGSVRRVFFHLPTGFWRLSKREPLPSFSRAVRCAMPR